MSNEKFELDFSEGDADASEALDLDLAESGEFELSLDEGIHVIAMDATTPLRITFRVKDLHDPNNDKWEPALLAMLDKEDAIVNDLRIQQVTVPWDALHKCLYGGRRHRPGRSCWVENHGRLKRALGTLQIEDAQTIRQQIVLSGTSPEGEQLEGIATLMIAASELHRILRVYQDALPAGCHAFRLKQAVFQTGDQALIRMLDDTFYGSLKLSVATMNAQNPTLRTALMQLAQAQNSFVDAILKATDPAVAQDLIQTFVDGSVAVQDEFTAALRETQRRAKAADARVVVSLEDLRAVIRAEELQRQRNAKWHESVAASDRPNELDLSNDDPAIEETFDLETAGTDLALDFEPDVEPLTAAIDYEPSPADGDMIDL